MTEKQLFTMHIQTDENTGFLTEDGESGPREKARHLTKEEVEARHLTKEEVEATLPIIFCADEGDTIISIQPIPDDRKYFHMEYIDDAGFTTTMFCKARDIVDAVAYMQSYLNWDVAKIKKAVLIPDHRLPESAKTDGTLIVCPWGRGEE